jgi:hypothetical protein
VVRYRCGHQKTGTCTWAAAVKQAAPDPERLGGLAWTERTRGRLSRRERRHLLGEIVRGQAQYVLGRIRLATGRVPAGARSLAVADLRPPTAVSRGSRRKPAGSSPPG